MKIGIYAGKCIPIHATTLEERPLGGTEAGIIRLADELHRRGHEVLVFTTFRNPPPSKPTYFELDQVAKHGPFDLFITVKDWRPVFFGVSAKRFAYWTGDSPDQYVNFGIGDRRVCSRIDLFFAVSRWHAETFCAGTGFPLEKAHVIGNGVHLPHFEGEEVRIPTRILYASPPYRGLRHMPAILMEVRRRNPNLELHVFSGMNLYDTESPYQGPENEEMEKIFNVLRSIPGCVLHGNVKQSELAREFMKSSILLYPNTVFETCCMTALEAQAGGCAVVTSNLGALPETVGDAGFVIKGVPGSAEYQRDMIESVQAILNDHELFQCLSLNGKQRVAKHFTWERVAERVEQAVDSGFVT